MRIVEMRSENVKRLKAVHIKPDGSLVVVGGKNGQGKSSVLDSIIYAISGAGSLPGKPVRNGEDKAEIEITLDSDPKLVIRRRITEGGKTDLEIKQLTADGVASKITSPQKLLDSLCGTIAFDPLAFTRLRPQEQVDLLRKVVGVDVADLDAEAKRVFDERTAVNRDVKALESQVTAAPKFDDAPESEVSVRELADKIDAVRQHNAAIRDQWAGVESLDAAVERAKSNVERDQQSIRDLESRLTAAKETLAASREELAKATMCRDNEKRHAEAATEQDDSALREQLDTAEETNRKVRANAQRAVLVERYKSAKEQSDDLTKQLDQLRQQRIDRLAAAEWPVEGLGFADNGVTYNGLPFEQCSSAEQLRISTAIGVAQNPKLRVWMIRDGSLLDEENLAAVAQLAEEHDAQIWVERVGKGAECSVILEDGAVVAARELVEA